MKLQHLVSELKRRNVFKVATIYGVTAWLIIQIAATTFPQFDFPKWTVQAVILLSVIGFPVALVLAWVYDIVPEKPVAEILPETEVPLESISAKRRFPRWIPLVLLVGLIGFTIWIFRKPIVAATPISVKEVQDKSIAVLPFRNESSDKEETQYFCNGVMESILNHIAQIHSLRVISRQSVERYRDSNKPIAEIAKDLGVAHILTGSVQRVGNQVKINAQLIYASEDRYLWGQEFIGDLNDIFKLQSNIAKGIADALQISLAPDEKARIERASTTNVAAWNAYLEANAAYLNYTFDFSLNEVNANKVLDLCNQVLAMDSTLAEAWTLKAQVWWDRNYQRDYWKSNFMDSVALFSKKALAFDPNSAMAHFVLGRYYQNTGQAELGLEYFEKAIELNPNEAEFYMELGTIYLDPFNLENRIEKSFLAYKTALKLAPNSVWSPVIFIRLNGFYLSIDIEKAEDCLLKAKMMSNAPFIQKEVFSGMSWIKTLEGKFEEALKWTEELKEVDSIGYLNGIANYNTYNHDFEKSLAAFNVLALIPSYKIPINDKHRWAYALWMSGDKKAGMEMFKEAQNNLLDAMKLGRASSPFLFDLAGISSFLGEEEKALQYLQEFDKIAGRPWGFGLEYLIQVDPLFENLRKTPAFKKFFQLVLADTEEVRQRIRKLEAEDTQSF